jgi:hypothetical protein
MNVEEETLRRIMREETRQIVREEVNQAIDAKLDARFADFETKLAKFFGDTHRYFDKRFDKFEKKFGKKFGAMQTSIDGTVGRLDDDDVERTAMSSQPDRHETNLGELARHTGATITGP